MDTKLKPSHLFNPNGMVNTSEYLALQPSERHIPGTLEKIQEQVKESGRRLVVLDDDPTGVQTVHGVPVLTQWSMDDLRWALRQSSPTFYVLTNSRSLPTEAAFSLNYEIAARLATVATEIKTEFALSSRSDSTLRGHYPTEIDALCASLKATRGHEFDGVILCPCFFEAGRITIDNVQWVRQEEALVPAGITEFASDASFGYSSSNLAMWVEEKTAGRVTAVNVQTISLADIRQGGPEHIFKILCDVYDEQPIIVNAEGYKDLEVFVLGLLAAEAAGKSFLYRTGPSFVRVRGGITEPGTLSGTELYSRRPRKGHGLILVGSHVKLTTQQLENALSLDGLHAIELSVSRLLNSATRSSELDRAVAELNRALVDTDVILYTSRELVTANAERTDFEIGRLISDSLVTVMKRVDRRLPLSFVVAKGGITASDIGTHGLGVRRAEVAGQMLPGMVPVWILPDDNEFAGLPYVIFPGNVGGPDALAQVIRILREDD